MNEQSGKPENPQKKTRSGFSRRDLLKVAAAGGGVAMMLGGKMTAYAAEGHEAGGHAAAAVEGSNQFGTMMFLPNHKMADGLVFEPPGAPAPGEVHYKVFDMDIRIAKHELLPGVEVHFFAFNGQVPGPEFHVTEGDWIQVNFTNRTEEMHTIHWHGLTVPYTMDGVPMITQDPVHPTHTFVYRFQAKPAGTRWYHCHWGTPLHASMAMHGAFIIHKKDDPLRKRFPYQREYTLMLESFDTNHAREEIDGLLEGMKQVNLLMKRGRLDPMTHGFFRNYGEFLQAVREGSFIPPYLQGRSSGVPINPNFFGINGKSYPATKRIGIKTGEWIRIRLINAGSQAHHMHLHGHDFWWVAQDGNDLPDPRQLNTIHVEPGGTYDIMVNGSNPGFWTFHDHRTVAVRNNGIYPGGMLTVLEYEDLVNPPYVPSVSIDQ